MKRLMPLFVGVSALLLGSLAVADDKKMSASEHGHDAMSSQGGQMNSPGSPEMHKAMMDGMKDMQGMKMTGDADVDFASMMIEHHEQAIAMSRVELKNGKDAQVKRTAQEIIDASQRDIATLTQWKSGRSTGAQ